MKSHVLGLVFARVLALSATASAEPPPPVTAAQPAPDRLDRLLGLARIWANVKFFHPAMFQRPILHADGRQLQQIGIQPQITVRPTLRGLRTGKDEVLERALRYLQTGK